MLVDTNILLRSHPSDPHYQLVTTTLAKLKQDREVLCVAPQNLVEYWVVATRPRENNGLGMQPTRRCCGNSTAPQRVPCAGRIAGSIGYLGDVGRKAFGFGKAGT